jgi:hypothetical protein
MLEYLAHSIFLFFIIEKIGSPGSNVSINTDLREKKGVGKMIVAEF